VIVIGQARERSAMVDLPALRSGHLVGVRPEPWRMPGEGRRRDMRREPRSRGRIPPGAAGQGRAEQLVAHASARPMAITPLLVTDVSRTNAMWSATADCDRYR
jgi:hypothetical protein